VEGKECAWCSNVYQRGAVLNALKAPSRHLRLSPFLFSPIHLCKLPPIPAWAAASQELQGAPLPGSYSHLSLCPSPCLTPSGANRNSNLKCLRHYRCTESMRACMYSRYTKGSNIALHTTCSCIPLHTQGTCTVHLPLLADLDLCAYARSNLSVRRTAEELVTATLRCAVQDHRTPTLHDITRAVL